MKVLRWIVAVIALLGVFFFWALGGFNPSVSWNRRLTVVVSTPNGDVSGYAVQRESIQNQDGLLVTPEASGASHSLGGEAVVVEIKPGHYLFALLVDYKPDTFQVLLPGEAPLEVATKMTQMRGLNVLPSSQYPMLVTFTDINDPKSVKEVKPDKLADAFGPGFALKSITLEITDEAATKGQVEKKLPFLAQENPVFIDANKYPSGHPLRRLNRRSFKTGS